MKTLAEIKIGETFKVADIEFIKFSDENGNTVAVSKDRVFNSLFGDNNNFAESRVKSRLENEILPKIEKAIGAENIVEHEVDLLSLDGDDKWGKAKCKISIPTFDFYRHNVKIFDKHKLDKWWWLATPYTTSAHYGDDWNVCVSPHGNIDDFNSSYGNSGVRPFIIFVSSISVISVSCEEFDKTTQMFVDVTEFYKSAELERMAKDCDLKSEKEPTKEKCECKKGDKK